MRTVKDDNKLLNELNFFFQDDLDLYFNFKRNIDAAYTMKLTTEAERDFLELNTGNYLFYTLDPKHWDTFLNYCRISDATDTPYLFIRKDGRLASIFCKNSEGVITHRKHVFDVNEIYDIYYSFENTFRQYRPARNLPQPTLAAAKEAVAV